MNGIEGVLNYRKAGITRITTMSPYFLLLLVLIVRVRYSRYKKTSKRQCSNARKTRVHVEIRNSSELGAQNRNDFDYRSSAGTKQSLEKSELEISRFYLHTP